MFEQKSAAHSFKCFVVAISLFLAISESLTMAAEEIQNGRIRGEDGQISIMIAVPLTSNNEVANNTNGWQHMAAAMMAVEQFNARDPTVVEDLRNFTDCGIYLNATVVDTGTTGHKAMKSIMRSMQTNGPPDAIAGPYNPQPALELSVVATGVESPIVAFRGMDQNLIFPEKHPFYSQVNPDLYGDMGFLGELLRKTGRTNYIAVIYTSEDSVLQRMEILRELLKQNLGADQVKTFGYLSLGKTSEGEKRGIRETLWKVSQTGYRTVIMLSDTPDADTPDIGRAAYDFELDTGNHFWIIPGGLETSTIDKNKILFDYRDKVEGGFLRGAAFTFIFEGQHIDPHDKYNAAFFNQNVTFVEKLRQINPVPDFFAHSFFGLAFAEKPDPFPPDDIFRRLPYLAENTGFAYDATMAIGIGACLATSNQNSTAMTGEAHLKGIRSVDFKGATGRVRFLNRPRTPGSRKFRSVYYGIINLLPPGIEGEVSQGTSFLDPQTEQWVEVIPFVYADGTNQPPKLLRREPEQNYLDRGIRLFGLSLMALSLFSIFLSMIWIFVHHSHTVVIAAQPPFLYVLCLGSAITSLVILISSFDESMGWNNAMLDMACIAMPWLVAMGHIVTYSALFTKLWRVNRVLQFKRTRIKVNQVAWPAIFLIATAMIILSVWTAMGEYGWEREEINDLTGESIGSCKGGSSKAFLVPVGVICVIPTLLTAVMAWKCSDVDDLYSESKWIFSLILVQLQVIFVSVPIIAILQSVSPNGRFIGLSLLISTFPLSCMGLILVPKMVMVRKQNAGATAERTRGSRQCTKISGMNAGGDGVEHSHPTEPHTAYTCPGPSFSPSAPTVQTVTIQ